MVNAYDSKYVTESSTGHIWSPEDRPQIQTQEPGSFPKPFRAERNPEGQAGGWWADTVEKPHVLSMGKQDTYRKVNGLGSQFPALPGSGPSRVDTSFTLKDPLTPDSGIITLFPGHFLLLSRLPGAYSQTICQGCSTLE